MKTIRIPLKHDYLTDGFEHHKDEEIFYLCGRSLRSLFDIKKRKEIDLVISDKELNASYKIKYDGYLITFKDIKNHPEYSLLTEGVMDSYIAVHLPSLIDKTIFVSIEI